MVLSTLNKTVSARFNEDGLGGAPPVLSMKISRYLNRGTVSVAQASHVRMLGRDGYKRVSTTGVGPGLSAQQSKQLDAEGTKLFQAIVRTVIYPAQVALCDD